MIRALDSRISDVIYVRLLWHPDNGDVSIAVEDTKTVSRSSSRFATGSQRSTCTGTLRLRRSTPQR